MSDENYAKNFTETYHFHPEEVESHAGLIKRLEVHLGSKIDNTEKFAPGHIMTWRTKRADGTEMVGYYAIDEILEDKESGEPSENTIKVRFLGNNTPEKDEEGRSVPPKINLNGGMPFYYSGSRFFEYLSGCTDE
jgi:hypothetical protein